MRSMLVVLLLLGGCLTALAQKPAEKQQAETKQEAKTPPKPPPHPFTVENLEKRMDGLRAGQKQAADAVDQAKANLNAYDGAIQELEHWLSQVRIYEAAIREEKPKEKPQALR